MRYRAKIDWWIGLSVLAGLVGPLAAAIVSSSLFMYMVFVFSSVLVFGFCYPQYYETAASCLLVRAGLRTIRIPYSQINAVRPSSYTRSALAMSLDRVLIEYESGEVLIAPKEKELFFTDIQARAPQLSKRGQDLVLAFV
jgi:hypothetical protein